jgi:hypothetical protein
VLLGLILVDHTSCRLCSKPTIRSTACFLPPRGQRPHGMVVGVGLAVGVAIGVGVGTGVGVGIGVRAKWIRTFATIVVDGDTPPGPTALTQ